MTMYGCMERLLKKTFARTGNGNWLISVGCVNYLLHTVSFRLTSQTRMIWCLYSYQVLKISVQYVILFNISLLFIPF